MGEAKSADKMEWEKPIILESIVPIISILLNVFFFRYICELCYTSHYKTVISCLQIMSSVVAYSNMAPESLPKFIEALCRTVNQEEYCQSSWKVCKIFIFK